jgi:hypothetical protein
MMYCSDIARILRSNLSDQTKQNYNQEAMHLFLKRTDKIFCEAGASASASFPSPQ